MRYVLLCAALLILASASLAATVDTVNPVEDATGDSVYVVKQRRCQDGTSPGLPCTTSGDCPGSGTCITTDTEGGQVSVEVRPPTATFPPSHRAITSGPDAIRCFNDTPTSVGPCRQCLIINHLVKNDSTNQEDPVYVGYADTIDDTVDGGGYPVYPGQSEAFDSGATEDCNNVYVYGEDEAVFSCACLP